VTGPVLKILSADEPWAEYQLEDGTTLRFRFTAASFRKTGKVINGLPEYSFAHHVHCETHLAKNSDNVLELVRDAEGEARPSA
jgi:hypothetical protein